MLPRIVHAHQGIGRIPTCHTCWLVWGEDGLSWLRRPLHHVPKIIGNMLITCILSVIGLATSNGVGLTAEIQKHLLNKEIQMIPPLTESQRIGIPSKSVARRSLEQSTASYQQFTIYTDELCEDVDAIASIAGSLLPGCQAFDDGTSAAAACSAEQFEDSLDISYFYYDSSDCSGEPGYMYDLHLPANCSGSTPAGSTYSKVSCVTGDAPWNDDKEGFISMSYGTNYTEAGCGCEDIVGYYKYYYDVCVVISNGSYVYSKGDCSSEDATVDFSFFSSFECEDLAYAYPLDLIDCTFDDFFSTTVSQHCMNYECSSSGNDVNSLTTGEIAGVAVGAFVGAAIIIAVIFFIWTRCISSGHQDLTALK